MPNKTIIPIEIDDSQFKAFAELFGQFQGKLGDLPADWDKVNESASQTQEALAAAMGVMTESMLQAKEHAKDLSEYLKQATEAQKQFRKATGQAESSMKRMTKDAKELAHTLFGIGKYLFKISVLGLGTAVGGLFGLDRLALSAINNQRGARGLGMTTGQLRAFQTDFGSRYMDDSVLQSVATARNDLTNRVWLQRALGISGEKMDRSDTGDLAVQLAIKAHDWWAGTPENQHNDAFFQSTGFAQSGISLEMARQLGNTNREELIRARNQYGQDAQGLTVSDHATDSLYGFTRQLDLAGQKLQALLTNRVSELGPALGNLMTQMEKGAEVLVNEIFSKKNVDALSAGIQTLSNFLGSQEFKDDVKTLVSGIGQIAKAIMSALRIIAPDTGPETDKDGNPVQETMKDHIRLAVNDPQAGGGDSWLGRYLLFRDNYIGSGKVAQQDAVYGGPYYNLINPNTQKGRSNLAYASGLEKTLGLPAGLLSASIGAESSGIANATSNKGALGAMQLMPGTAKEYGVTDPFDFNQNVRGGASYYAWLQNRYKDDLRKQIGAYNWGPGNLDKAVSKYGNDWESHAPTETRNHIKRVLDLMAKDRNKPIKVELDVTNKSGTNVAVSTNAGSL